MKVLNRISLTILIAGVCNFSFSQSIKLKISFVGRNNESIFFNDTAGIFVDQYEAEKKGGLYTVRVPAYLSSAMIKLSGTRHRVVFPVDSKIYLPHDTNYIIPVIVEAGKQLSPVEKLATELVALNQQLEKSFGQNNLLKARIDSLERQGKQLDSLAFIEAIKKEIRKNEYYKEISMVLLNYVNEAKDFKDSFRFLSGAALSNKGVLTEMYRYVKSYDTAYKALNNSKAAFASLINDFWDSELETDYNTTVDYLLEDLHKAKILALNPLGARINEFRDFAPKNKTDRVKEEEGLKKEIAKAVVELENIIPVAEKKTDQLLAKLND